jgi:hypothetical protein
MNSKNIYLKQQIQWTIKQNKPFVLFSLFCLFFVSLLAGIKYIAH